MTGVTLANGESLDATVVLSTLDPKTTFLRLMDPGLLPARLTEHIGAWRTRGIVAHLLLALNQPLRFAARPTERVAHALVAGSLNELEQAFDAVKYGRSSETPVLDVCVPTVEDASLAPAGHEVVSVLVYFAPHDPEGGWTPQSRDALAARALDRLEAAAPGVKGSLVAQVLRTPAGLEAEFGLSGGHLHHGEHALDQILVRPAPDCVKYGTPVGGLYLGGGGSHPGGGPTGAPGVMAAKALLGR